VEGDAKRVGAIAGELEATRNQFLDIYVERTGASRETLAAIMDENVPMSVERAKELGFISDIIVPISAKNKLIDMNKKSIWRAFGKLLGVYGMTLETADGKTLELQKESGEPVVGDEVVSDDGEYLLPDGRTVVVESGVITEIRPAEEPATEEAVEEEAAERGEETADGDAEQRETDSDKDAEIDRLKAEIAEKDAEIDRLRRKLESAQANAKSEEDSDVLAMVETAGGIEWLKNVRSNAVVAQRETSTANAERANEKRTERVGFAEYMANRRKK
jgi:ATP-dependent Clp protease protease subunit